jgi:hypothetical protein
MNAQPYKATPDSETARLVKEAASSRVPRVDTGDGVYRLNADAESPESPPLPTAAIKRVAGAWKDLVDADELKAYLRERRKTVNCPSLER